MRQIPFYSNRKDNQHCFEACIRSALEYFFPRKKYSWDKIDKITQKRPGVLSWPMAGLVYLADHGIEIKVIDPFSYRDFAKEGLNFLRKEWGEKKFTVKEFISHPLIQIQKKVATIADLKEVTKDFEIVMSGVNAKALHYQKGTLLHVVIILEIKKRKIVLNDPGLPPYKEIEVGLGHFKKAFYGHETIFGLRKSD